MGFESTVCSLSTLIGYSLKLDRFYQATRRRNNNLERIRTQVENEIIDELVEWSMYIYATGEGFQGDIKVDLYLVSSFTSAELACQSIGGNYYLLQSTLCLRDS